MEEKRRTKRMPVELKLGLSSLFKQDNVKVDLSDESIEVVNVSKGGIGFLSKSILPTGYYFNAKLKLLEEEGAKLYCVVKILRHETQGEYILYGCEFVGFPSVLDYIFDEYEEIVNHKKQ